VTRNSKSKTQKKEIDPSAHRSYDLLAVKAPNKNIEELCDDVCDDQVGHCVEDIPLSFESLHIP
jgi:hypothetical protein